MFYASNNFCHTLLLLLSEFIQQSKNDPRTHFSTLLEWVKMWPICLFFSFLLVFYVYLVTHVTCNRKDLYKIQKWLPVISVFNYSIKKLHLVHERVSWKTQVYSACNCVNARCFFFFFYIMSIVVMQLFRNQIQYIQIKFHTLALLS